MSGTAQVLTDGVIGLGYVGFRVASPAELVEWSELGTDVFGFVASSSPDEVRFRLDERPFRLAFRREEAPTPIAYVGWEVTDSAELDRLVGRLEAAGHPVTASSTEERAERGVDGMVHLADPVGIRTELFYGATTAAIPFDSPTGARFVTGEQGLGHLNLSVERFDEVLGFYTGLLGLQVTEGRDEPRRQRFLHCNPRHHSLAIGEASEPGAAYRLGHLMVQVDDLATVGQAQDACLDAKLPLSRTIGAHHNDRMTSFYLRTPSDFELEFGWGGLVVDPAKGAPEEIPGRSNSWGHRRL